MTKDDKIKFIIEIVQLEGGCIEINKIFNNQYDIKYITSDGVVLDYTIGERRKYLIRLQDQADAYIDFLYEIINNIEYNLPSISDVVKNIYELLRKEGESIFLTTKLNHSEPGADHGIIVGYINIIFEDKSKSIKINVYSGLLKSRENLQYSQNIYLLDKYIFDFIVDQIENNNYL